MKRRLKFGVRRLDGAFVFSADRIKKRHRATALQICRALKRALILKHNRDPGVASRFNRDLPQAILFHAFSVMIHPAIAGDTD